MLCTHPGVELTYLKDTVTCIHCFSRLVVRARREPLIVEAPPPPSCEHPSAVLWPLDRSLEDGSMLAVCQDCACIVKHPDGPGKWVAAKFYGYLIPEEDEL